MGERCATQLVGTITVSASGSGSNIESIQPAQSNTPFEDLVIVIKPVQADTQYNVGVYFFGELTEEHSYPDENDNVVAIMRYPQTFLPANVGTNVIPAFFDPNRQDFGGLPVLVQITNRELTERVFEVYGIFKAWDHCRFGVIQQES